MNTEVVASATSRDWDTAAYWIPVQRDWTRKLQVSTYLRGRRLTRYQRAKADVVLERLELLEHEIEARRAEEAERLARALHPLEPGHGGCQYLDHRALRRAAIPLPAGQA